MFNKTYKLLFIGLTVLLGFTAVSCVNDLSTTPLDEDVVTSESVYETPEDFKQVLAKLYAGFATTGQRGPAGDADIQGIDEGFSSYMRQYFTHQQNPTDENIIGWGDEGLPQFNTLSWTASNDFIMGMYSRIFYEIAMTNEFIRNAEGRDEAEIQAYVAEARFLRALSYWHALDLFGGNVPFVTEEDAVGAEPPTPTNADDLFAFIENELLEIASEMPAPGANEYGRADRGAAWMLLTKLYLNAEVYVGQDRYNDALTYAENVVDDPAYQLNDNYAELFMADNHTADGIIFPITFDGINTTSFGGTNFIVHAQVGGNMNAADYAIEGGWAGYRVTPEFVNKFSEEYPGYETPNPNGDDVIYVPGGYQGASGYGSDWTPADAPALVADNNDGVYSGHVYFESGAEFKYTAQPNWDNGDWGVDDDGNLVAGGGSNLSVANGGLYFMEVNTNNLTVKVEINVNLEDSRDMFFADGQTLEVEDISDFNSGYAVQKWTNKTSTGQNGKDLQYVDTDFPMFRLADAYLMYAEATVRGAAGGDLNKAVGLVNDLRFRAYGDNSGDITAGELTLDFLIDERSRELYWEGHRRTDLRRFGLYTSDDYVWSWKGGVQEGQAVSDIYEIYPLPSSDVNANPNLTQNPGY